VEVLHLESLDLATDWRCRVRRKGHVVMLFPRASSCASGNARFGTRKRKAKLRTARKHAVMLFPYVSRPVEVIHLELPNLESKA
jgi:hypothetical protein